MERMPKIIDLNEFVYPTAKLFGDRLKALRLAAGLTQGDVAKRVNITTSYLSQLERGRANPTLDMMVRLAGLFETEAWDLIRPDADQTINASGNATPD